jgi:predicted MPP superfamily phosphohydrolase
LFRFNFFIILFLMCLLSQIISWRLFLKRWENPLYRRVVSLVFILFNVSFALTVYFMFTGDVMSGPAWTFVGRPALSWEFTILLGVIPLSFLALVVYLPGLGIYRIYKRIGGKRSPGEPQSLADRESSSKSDSAEKSGIVKEEAEAYGAAAKPAPVGTSAPLDNPDDGSAVVGGRRRFLRTAGNVGLFGIVALGAYGVFRQSGAPRVRRLELKIKDLPRALMGLSICHISDVHLGLWSNQRELSLALETASREKPDMLVFTGDLVDRNPEISSLYEKPLREYFGKTPLGVYGILGNHDHHTNPGRITKILNDSGVRMLVEERVNIEGLPLSLTGLDDQGYHKSSWLRRRKAVDEEGEILFFDEVRGPEPREGDFRILLNHRPEGFRQAAVKEGYGLYLAGHTHGGQYALPFVPGVNLAKLVYKYTNGLYSDFGSHINVSCGLAAVGIPFRFGPFPEISLITLRRA